MAVTTETSNATMELAIGLARAGVSVVAIECDGSKQPPSGCRWKHLQERIATNAEIEEMFRGGKGVATIGGKVSGNLEILDIDDPTLVQDFEQAVRELAPDLLAMLSTTATPRGNGGGRHYRYRLAQPVEGNTKLAQSEPRSQFNSDGTPLVHPATGLQRHAPETLIETRGEGGYAIAPGSPTECHASGVSYKHISGPPLTEIQTITAEDHQLLMSVARSFNRYVEEREVTKGTSSASKSKGMSPGDDFNARATWDELLVPAGWTKGRSRGEVTTWCRPGKSGGVSATTGCRSSAGTELLCVFSTNAFPFEGPANGHACSSYSKFAVYAALNHNGDFTAAAKDLAAKGYGENPIAHNQNGRPKPKSETSKTPAVPARKVQLPEPFVPFPFQVLPHPIDAFIFEASRAIGCDPTLVGLPMLATLAGCIGTSRRLRIKRGWYAPAVLWTAAVVESGQQKSPAQGVVTRLLYDRQGRDLAEHAARMVEYQRQFSVYERELSEWKRAKGSAKGDPPEKPQEPVCKRIVLSDSTIEAVADRLNDNPRGLLLDRDELSGWLGSYDQYRSGKGSDVSHWLSCYNAKPLLIDRKTSNRRTIYVERAAVSITGGIQPRILGRMLGAQHFENGLAARFGFGMPPRTGKKWSEACVSADTEDALDWVYDWLLTLGFGTDQEGRPVPIDLSLTLDGKDAFVEFYDRHGQEQMELTGDLAALWAKLEEVAARIALIVHLVRCAIDDTTLLTPDAVDGSSIAAGVTLARWFGNEGRRIYAVLAETEEQRDLRELINYIMQHGGALTPNDLARGPRLYRGNPEFAEFELQRLVGAGLAHWEYVPPGEQGGRPTRRLRLKSYPPGAETPSTPDGNQGFCSSTDHQSGEKEEGE